MESSAMFESASPLFQEALTKAKKIASSEKSILLRGDTGTGKELLAKFIHDNSKRKDKPYNTVNIVSYNENLFESELFGYIKGAFTGANEDKKGAIEDAGEGTLFLDEIGNLSIALQAKLLRVVDNRQYRPVGSTCDKELKARIISATSKDLESMMKDGTFLEDLYYRLDINLRIPSLSERREDIPDFVKYFLEKEKQGSTAPAWFYEPHIQFITDVLVAKNYHWPGNIRQLKSVLGEIYELCVRDCQEAEFEANVSKIIAGRCTDGQKHGYSEVVRGLSTLVHNHVVSYKDNDRPLRAVIDEVLIEGIGTGLDMAIVNRKYIPQNPKHIGRTLGIKSLMNGSRYNLPRDENDYILATLRSLNPNEEKYPDKFKEVLYRC